MAENTKTGDESLPFFSIANIAALLMLALT